MRSLSLTVLLASVLILFGTRVIAEERASTPPGFGSACELMLDMPYGEDVLTIENALVLDRSKRQARQDKNYKGIIFTYSRGDGLVVDLGVKRLEPNAQFPAGKYAYQGHHTIVWKHKVWHRWEYANGKQLDYFGLADRGHD